MNTWTPTALASEGRPGRGSGWRAVEAQHRVATMSLVHGKLDDQALLEDILEEAKPRLPAEAEGLHWLLATPFRYWPRPTSGSRFRRRGDPGVFYGGEDRRTACAECGYWRWRFWMDSAGLAGKSATVAITLFEFHWQSGSLIDLSLPPFVGEREAWTAPDDYGATQALAGQARAAEIGVIRYESARHAGGHCLAILTPRVFKDTRRPFRNRQETWSLLIQPPNLTVWQRDLTRDRWSFCY